GAVVYGHRLAQPVTAEELYARLGERWVRVPGAIRWLASRLSGTVRERLAPLVNGLRLIAHAGMRPVLLFCPVFLLGINVDDASRGPLGGLGSLLLEVERLIIGPREFNEVWVPNVYLFNVLNEAVQAVLLICLVAVAVDRVLLAQRLEPVLATPNMSL